MNISRKLKDTAVYWPSAGSNWTGGESFDAPEEKAPNGTKQRLVNCTNRFHLKGEYGFYVDA